MQAERMMQGVNCFDRIHRKNRIVSVSCKILFILSSDQQMIVSAIQGMRAKKMNAIL